MLVKFEQNQIVQTIKIFEYSDEKQTNKQTKTKTKTKTKAFFFFFFFKKKTFLLKR